MYSPLRRLLLSTTVALAGGAAVIGLPSGAASPSLVAHPIEIASPAPQVWAPRALPVGLPPSAEEIVRQQEAAGLDCRVSSKDVPLCLHGEDTMPQRTSVAGGATGSTSTGGRVGCYGDGTSGPRVRAVYARPASAPDRYTASLPSIRGWAAGVSKQIDDSAKRTGGRRHVRFATTPGASCALTVLNVVLPDSAFRSFEATVDALEQAGHDAPSSKYLVWADAAGVCGMATTYADDRPGLENLNNSRLPAYSRIDRKCWGKVETHELVHMLGGVQTSAKNSTGGFHCNDGQDPMCYDDGTARSAQRSVCSRDAAHLLDCRSDDYFSTSAPKGSYLQTHWNTARSSYLSAVLDEAAPTKPSPAVATKSPSPSPSPSASSPSVRTLVPTPLPSPLSSIVPPVAVPDVADVVPSLAPVVDAGLPAVTR